MTDQKGITIIGLGPGNLNQITLEAMQALQSTEKVYLRTSQHPAVEQFPADIQWESFDSLYDASESFEEVYQEIIETILKLGANEKGVVYAVPGNPCVAEITGPEIMRRADETGLPVTLIAGISFIEPTMMALNIDPYADGLVLMDALEINQLHYLNYSPNLPALIGQVYSKIVASDLKLALANVYPDTHEVVLIHAAGTEKQIIEKMKLYEIDRSSHIGLLSSLYVPGLPKGSSFEDFQEQIAHLRAPEGCPWDREQTHQSLRSTLLEETYEVLDAMDSDDEEAMREEFGDLLLQVVLNAQIASETGSFTMTDIIHGIFKKIEFRHPHVFGSAHRENTDEVLVSWESLKAEERKHKHNGEPSKGSLDSVPASLPALALAQSYQSRVARIGFDWPDIEGVLDKIVEEIQEVREADDSTLKGELGDLLFSIVNLVRWYKVDAESALRETNQKFLRRFKYIEQKTLQNDLSLEKMTLQEMDQLWDEAKQIERQDE
ncbi:MAG: nucleoside triphosphate pyrophosphohydrolase [Anaerolineaceae bacterium]|nr:nucleoside triphosphate pyrophosphohydrolase [Anaerolineaceae bacterium]